MPFSQYAAAGTKILAFEMKNWPNTPEELPVFDLVDGEMVTAHFSSAIGIAMDINGDLLITDYDEAKLYRVNLCSRIRTKIYLKQGVDHDGMLCYPGSSVQ